MEEPEPIEQTDQPEEPEPPPPEPPKQVVEAPIHLTSFVHHVQDYGTCRTPRPMYPGESPCKCGRVIIRWLF